METSLHRQLKHRYASQEADTEVVVGKYRVDAVRGDELVEIQCASLAAIRGKAEQLLRRHRLRVVKPIVVKRRIRRLTRAGGKVRSQRMSPKRGGIVDMFDDLIYFTRVFPHPNLTLEVPLVQVTETRVPRQRRRRWHRDYRVEDVELEAVLGSGEFSQAADLLDAINSPALGEGFNTAELAVAIDRPRWFAQKVAYVLRHTGAIEARARKRTGIVYSARPAA